MAISEKELERIIGSQFSKEFDANIEVPDINNQWQKIKEQIMKEKLLSIKPKLRFLIS